MALLPSLVPEDHVLFAREDLAPLIRLEEVLPQLVNLFFQFENSNSIGSISSSPA
jgi:hypothetical protein